MRARDLLPWREIVVETSWPPSVATTELKKRIDGPGLLGMGDAAFFGRARADGLRFATRRRMQVVMRAVVGPSHHGGACLRVRMRAPLLSILVVGAGLILLTSLSLTAALGGEASALVILVLPATMTTVFAVSFAMEASRAERQLRAIFATAPALPAPPVTGEAYR